VPQRVLGQAVKAWAERVGIALINLKDVARRATGATAAQQVDAALNEIADLPQRFLADNSSNASWRTIRPTGARGGS